MKKLMMAVAVLVVAFALSANAQTTKVEEKVTGPAGGKADITKTTTPTETVTDVKAKSASGDVKVQAEKVQTADTTNITTEIKKKTGDVAKETVIFQKYEANGNWIYVLKDNKEIRVKHTPDESMKKNMLSLKTGTPITITSTYPLSKADLATAVAVDIADRQQQKK